MWLPPLPDSSHAKTARSYKCKMSKCIHGHVTCPFCCDAVCRACLPSRLMAKRKLDGEGVGTLRAFQSVFQPLIESVVVTLEI